MKFTVGSYEITITTKSVLSGKENTEYFMNELIDLYASKDKLYQHEAISQYGREKELTLACADINARRGSEIYQQLKANGFYDDVEK